MGYFQSLFRLFRSLQAVLCNNVFRLELNPLENKAITTTTRSSSSVRPDWTKNSKGFVDKFSYQRTFMFIWENIIFEIMTLPTYRQILLLFIPTSGHTDNNHHHHQGPIIRVNTRRRKTESKASFNIFQI